MAEHKGLQPRGTHIRIRVQHNGKIHTQNLQCKNPHAKSAIAAAIRIRDELKSKLSLGLPLIDEESEQANFFSVICQEWVDSLDLERSTVMDYLSALNKYWLPKFGQRLIQTIRPKEIQKFINDMEVSSKRKRNVLLPFRRVFDFAINEELILGNPCRSIEIKKHQKKILMPFNAIEKRRILGKFENQILLYFTLFFEAGLRPGEILALQWSDFDGESLHVVKSVVRRRLKPTTKTHEERVVHCTPALIKELKRALSRFKQKWILPNINSEHHKDSDNFNLAWRKALKELDIFPYRVPYYCRHTRASEMLTGGVAPAFAAKQLGHSLETFMRIYARWIDMQGNEKQFGILKKLAENWPVTS